MACRGNVFGPLKLCVQRQRTCQHDALRIFVPLQLTQEDGDALPGEHLAMRHNMRDGKPKIAERLDGILRGVEQRSHIALRLDACPVVGRVAGIVNVFFVLFGLANAHMAEGVDEARVDGQRITFDNFGVGWSQDVSSDRFNDAIPNNHRRSLQHLPGCLHHAGVGDGERPLNRPERRIRSNSLRVEGRRKEQEQGEGDEPSRQTHRLAGNG